MLKGKVEVNENGNKVHVNLMGKFCIMKSEVREIMFYVRSSMN